VAQEGLDFLQETVREVLKQQGRHFDSVALQDIFGFLRAVLVHVPFVNTADLRTEGSLSFDVSAWSDQGYAKPLDNYRFLAPQRFEAAMDPGKSSVLRQRVATFGEHPSGLGKFTRTLFARDLRRELRFLKSACALPIVEDALIIENLGRLIAYHSALIG